MRGPLAVVYCVVAWPACRSPVQYGTNTKLAFWNGLLAPRLNSGYASRLACSASNSAAPNGVSMLAAVRSSKQVCASQHAPPPFNSTTTSLGPRRAG